MPAAQRGEIDRVGGVGAQMRRAGRRRNPASTSCRCLPGRSRAPPCGHGGWSSCRVQRDGEQSVRRVRCRWPRFRSARHAGRVAHPQQVIGPEFARDDRSALPSRRGRIAPRARSGRSGWGCSDRGRCNPSGCAAWAFARRSATDLPGRAGRGPRRGCCDLRTASGRRRWRRRFGRRRRSEHPAPACRPGRCAVPATASSGGRCGRGLREPARSGHQGLLTFASTGHHGEERSDVAIQGGHMVPRRWIATPPSGGSR